MPPVPPQVKNYQFSEKLGSGSYGEVYKAYKKSGAREVCAIKCVQKNKITKHEADAIVAEISILKSLKLDFIVEMLDFQVRFVKSYFISCRKNICISFENQINVKPIPFSLSCLVVYPNLT